MNIRVLAFVSLLLAQLLLGTAMAEEGEAAPVSVQYHELKPAFVTNFGTENGKKLKFLKAGISIRVSNSTGINEVVNHDALVRHQIVMLLSRQSESTLASSAGQEKVRKEALKVVQGVLEKETGDTQIDDLLFTSFVIQR